MGGREDFQLWADLRRIFTGRVDDGSAAEFPLVRDVASWFFVLMVAGTCVIVHRQWVLMSDCLSDAAKSGALKPAKATAFSRLHRMILLPRLLSDASPANYLPILVQRVNNGMARAGRYVVVVGVAAGILALLLVVGENKNGLFRVLAPSSLTGGARSAWVEEAYGSWWASIHEHPFGFISYLCIAGFGIFVILLQNVVGVACTYLIVSLSAVCEIDADWLNRDGLFGWRSVGEVFRTVRWSLALHGAALSVAVLVLGVDNFPWILVLVAIWVVVVPLFAVMPILTFRAVERAVRERRVKQLEAELVAQGRATDVTAIRSYRDEIEYTHSARIRPLKSKRASVPALLVLVVLPVVLTGAQIFFSVRFGSQRP